MSFGRITLIFLIDKLIIQLNATLSHFCVFYENLGDFMPCAALFIYFLFYFFAVLHVPHSSLPGRDCWRSICLLVQTSGEIFLQYLLYISSVHCITVGRGVVI